MSQFAPGIPYVPGQQSDGTVGGTGQAQQSLQRLAQNAVAYTLNGLQGQAVIFDRLDKSNLLFARVSGVIASNATLFIGQGGLAEVLRPENYQSTTVAGAMDEASWARPGLPVYKDWSVGVFWDRTSLWGTGVASIYFEQVVS